MDWPSIIDAGASVATAIAVLLAGWQIRLAKKQSRTQFEDDLTRQYREITKDIPTDALLNQVISEEEYQKARHALYRYIDLSNEQIFLRQQGRVSKETWELWRDGIKSHLEKPTFKRAWDEFRETTEKDFNELRELADNSFIVDPKERKKSNQKQLKK